MSSDQTSVDSLEKPVNPYPLKRARDLEENKVEDVGPLGFCDSANLAFSDIRYRVTSHKGGRLEILKGISGICRSGSLLALMGASGEAALPPVGRFLATIVQDGWQKQPKLATCFALKHT